MLVTGQHDHSPDLRSILLPFAGPDTDADETTPQSDRPSPVGETRPLSVRRTASRPKVRLSLAGLVVVLLAALSAAGRGDPSAPPPSAAPVPGSRALPSWRRTRPLTRRPHLRPRTHRGASKRPAPKPRLEAATAPVIRVRPAGTQVRLRGAAAPHRPAAIHPAASPAEHGTRAPAAPPVSDRFTDEFTP